MLLLLLLAAAHAHDYPACYLGQIEGPGFISFDHCSGGAPSSIVCKDTATCGLDKCGGPQRKSCDCSTDCHVHMDDAAAAISLRCGCDSQGCFCDNDCKFTSGTRWRSLDRPGVVINATLGPCLGCMCELDTAGFDSAVCQRGDPRFKPPSDADLCLGPIGMCAAKGRWAGLGCRMLNFSKGDPMPTGLPDPLDTLGSSWVRVS